MLLLFLLTLLIILGCSSRRVPPPRLLPAGHSPVERQVLPLQLSGQGRTGSAFPPLAPRSPSVRGGAGAVPGRRGAAGPPPRRAGAVTAGGGAGAAGAGEVGERANLF